MPENNEQAVLDALKTHGRMTWEELAQRVGHQRIGGALLRLMEQKRVQTVDNPMATNLFGKWTGTYWVENFARGKTERGQVQKRYNVKPDKALED